MARPPHAQLALDLGAPPRYGRDDFLPAPCNRAALDVLERWPAWTDRVVLLRGPPGAGKSHLAAIWSDLSAAPIISAASLDETALDRLRDHGALALEDADRCLRDEATLFHLLDMARQAGYFVLLTARADPSVWPICIADLRSRLRLSPIVTIGDPDESLLRAVLVKLLADRQIAVEPQLLDYVTKHLGRSLADARSLVDLADRRSLAAKGRITRTIAAEVLADLSAARDADD